MVRMKTLAERLVEIKEKIIAHHPIYVDEEELNSVIEWEGELCKIRDIPTLRIEALPPSILMSIKLPWKTILPKERYTATKEKLRLSGGKIRETIHYSFDCDENVTHVIHDLEECATPEEKVRTMQYVMNRQKQRDIDGMIANCGYDRDEIFEEDDVHNELELHPLPQWISRFNMLQFPILQ